MGVLLSMCISCKDLEEEDERLPLINPETNIPSEAQTRHENIVLDASVNPLNRPYRELLSGDGSGAPSQRIITSDQNLYLHFNRTIPFQDRSQIRHQAMSDILLPTTGSATPLSGLIQRPWRLLRSRSQPQQLDSSSEMTSVDQTNHSQTQPIYDPIGLRAIQDRIQSELVLLVKGSEEEKNEIVLGQDLEIFWSVPRRSLFFTKMPWYHLSLDERENTMRKYFKIFSILIRINFMEWSHFWDLFIIPGNSDANLPFPLEKLSNKRFLGPCTGRLFYTMQWVFCPMVIEIKQEPHVLKGKDLNYRFPFIGSGKRVGEGACGVVHRQVIAARHLRNTEETTENSKDIEVAVKVITQTRFLASELENHKSISLCLTKHRNIMANIATIIREQNTTGNVYYIFYPLAAYDLEKMLTRNWIINRRKRHSSAPRNRNGSYEVQASQFVNESRHLVDALDFLHHRLYTHAKVSLAHNDLTPRNILVFYPYSAERDVKYPVGQWKIADFGLSKIKNTRHARQSSTDSKSSGYLSPDSQRLTSDLTRPQMIPKLACLSLTPAKRPPGRYTPPEIKDEGNSELNAKMGDVWAFGAIFSEILAYAVGADQFVSDLRRIFEKDNEDRFFDLEAKTLKKSFTDWMTDLPKKSGLDPDNHKWIDQCVTLIRNILVQDAPGRLPAARIRDTLQAIHDNHMRGKEQVWPGLLIDTSVASSSQGSRSASAHSAATTTSPEQFHHSPRSPSFCSRGF